ncbi:MAG: VWA domain-containing protein [Planctomycetes bacterium]|nr:VWA domain-containing protein [Planctomycetota bacterium]
MLAFDLQSLSLASPQNLTLAAAGGVALILLVAGLKSRHPAAARYGALVVRLLVLAALGLALASPSITAQTEERFAPQGVWNLAADGSAATVSNFSARVRTAFAEGKPPSLIEISGKPAHVRAAAAIVEPLEVPVRLKEEAVAGDAGPVLVSVDAPALLSPGEPLAATLRGAGRGGDVRFLVDGKEVAREPLDADALGWPQLALEPGRHDIVAELMDGDDVRQRIGHVLRVDRMPRLIALGMTGAEFARLETLAPNYERRAIDIKDFSKANLQEAEVVVLPILAGLDMTDRQAHALMQFAANGGGVLITADGAEQVSPEMLPSELRELLPVRLMQQPRVPPPDPPVKEEIGKAEVAAVSIMYVIDRSTSMESKVGKATRWDIAVEAVRKSLEKLDAWDRASVVAFTLKRTWMPRPQVVAPFDRELIARELRDLEPDHEYDPRGYNTDIYKAVEEGLDVLEKEPSAVKMMVLLTDGGDRDDDGGKARNHRALAERAISKKINIVTLGIGDGFNESSMGSASARRLINDIATKPGYAYIAPDAKTAEVAPVVFVRAVELSYEAYTEEMQRRELEKKKRAVDQPQKPPVVEVAKGDYALQWTTVEQQLLGSEIPKPPPRLAQYALTRLREHSANAITLGGVKDEQPALLTLGGYALGRVAFWASGLDDESLGGVGQWKDFPRFYAQLVRWLQPRNEPDPRLISGATRAGIGLIDPIEGAQYVLRRDGVESSLELENGELRAREGTLPDGAAEIIERMGSEERHIGDVFITERPAAASVARVLDEIKPAADLAELPPIVRTTRREALEPLMALLIAALALMPIERFVRRRS